MRYRRELQAKVSTFEIGWSFSFLFRCLSFSYCIEMLSKTRQTEKNRHKKKMNFSFSAYEDPPLAQGLHPSGIFHWPAPKDKEANPAAMIRVDRLSKCFIFSPFIFVFYSLFFALLDSFSLPSILFSFVIFLKFKHSSSPCSTTQYPHSMIE